MLDPAVADEMTRLSLRLLEKKLEQERESVDRDPEEPHLMPGLEAPGTKEEEALRGARRRRQLLQRLWDQHLLEELAAAQARVRVQRAAWPLELPSEGIYSTPPTLQALETPRVFHHSVPPAPTTIIQQLPQQPLIAQLPPPQAFPTPRPGSIKEDMVELMLMQTVQLHQVLMHSLTLRALPPGVSWLQTQDSLQAAAGCARGTENPRSAVHHHHHYAPPAPMQPSPFGCSPWPPVLPVSTGLLPAVHHLAGPSAATLSQPADNIMPTQNPGL
ncbi:uncharacterized protein C21orf58 homolog isoform X1 [Erinaceus europaeus]|uniref:Uncharacterized protein C21orf58 homolog isoform X1 n=2 Tax=Erinaceus europaeus TaxID=9365 RepID=A0ABM3Y199_ERIEU|nr:uncharacterized protein C21orf58 homolog isoform X1 [Erinaceus europaeus]